MSAIDYAADRPSARYERWRWQIFAITWLAYAGFYLTRKSFPVAKIGIQADRYILGACLFAIGFLLFCPDTLIAGAAAIDFGTKKGASTASGMINGFGSIGGMLGGSIPGFFSERWGWGGVFGLLGGMVILAAAIMAPRWNALPPEQNARPGGRSSR